MVQTPAAPNDVSVVGAGITGLMIAHYLHEQSGDVASIYAREFSRDTVSWVSGGWIYPFHAVDKRIAGPLALEGDREWRRIAAQHPDAGIVTIPCRYVTLDRAAVLPPVVKRLPGYREIGPEEMPPVAATTKGARGFTYDAVVVQMVKFLPWLEDRLRGHGVRFEEREFLDVAETAELGHKVVITAVAAGRVRLFADNSLYGVRGDLLLARIPANFAPRVEFLEFADGSLSYAIPYPDLGFVKIGGTYAVSDQRDPAKWTGPAAPADLAGIRERLRMMLPDEADEILSGEYDAMAGYRPASDHYRLAETTLKGHAGQVHRIDTDGAGGSGVTIAPAVARIVATRTDEILRHPWRRLRGPRWW